MFDKLLKGWSQLFGAKELIEEYHAKAVALKYAREERFDLEDYRPGSFPAGGELFDEVPEDALLTYMEYGMDMDGLPCYCRVVYKAGGRGFAGFYRYLPEAAEYVEFNLALGVPARFQRLEFQEGLVVASLRAIANGGGAAFGGMNSAQALTRVKKDEHCMLLSVRRYEYTNGRIIRDVNFHRAPGVGFYRFEGLYKYGDDGRLVEIKDREEDGRESLRYVREEEGEDLDALSDRLSREMAESIVNTLIEEEVETPMAILELMYRSVSNYWPGLNPLSLAQKQEIVEDGGEEIWRELFIRQDWLDARPRGFEATYTQYIQQVKSIEGYRHARTMLRKVAAILTKTRLLGRISVDEEFFAYAIDHSSEGHGAEDFKDILLKCGMREKQYEEWAERGWMR